MGGSTVNKYAKFWGLLCSLAIIFLGGFFFEEAPVYAANGFSASDGIEAPLGEATQTEVKVGTVRTRYFNVKVNQIGYLKLTFNSAYLTPGATVTIYYTDGSMGILSLNDTTVKTFNYSSSSKAAKGTMQTEHVLVPGTYTVEVKINGELTKDRKIAIKPTIVPVELEDNDYTFGTNNNNYDKADVIKLNSTVHQYMLSGINNQKDVVDVIKFPVTKKQKVNITVKPVTKVPGATVKIVLAKNDADHTTVKEYEMTSATINKTVTLAKGYYYLRVYCLDSELDNEQIIYKVRTMPAQLVTGVKLSRSKATLASAGDENSITLKTTVTPSDAADPSMKWTSSDTSVAKVSQKGYVVAVAPGTATITAAAKDGSGKKASCTITVKKRTMTLSPTSITLSVGEKATIESKVSPAADITWVSSNKNVVAVSQKGTIKGVKAGTAKIYIKTDKDGQKSKAVTVKVINETVSISRTTLGLYAGNGAALSATVNPSASVTWHSSNTSVAKVNANGYVTAVAPGTANVYAQTANGTRSVNCVVTVYNASVSISQTSASIFDGTSITLSASSTSGESISWSSSNTAVATVSGGKVTGVAAGTATIYARTSSGASASCTVTVSTANTPVLKASGGMVKIGGQVTITADVSGGSWSVNGNLKMVSSNGTTCTVEGVSAGTGTVTYKANGKSASVNVTVTP